VHIITSRSAFEELPEDIPDGTRRMRAHRVVPGWGWGCWRQALPLAKELSLDVLNIQYQAAAYGMHPAVNVIPRPQSRPPVVTTFHDLKVPYLFPKAGPLRWWVVRMLASRSDGVIVTNREDYLRLEDEIASHKLHRIPIGSNIDPVAPADYDRDAERARWGINPGDLLLGYFGFLNESKGGEELVQTLNLLLKEGVPAHLLKIGGRAGTSDPTNVAYAERIERLITELGLAERVHRTGYLSPTQVTTALLATDICVLPYRDGVSFRRGSLLACLAHGRAIVTTRPSVPLTWIRDGENMLLVQARESSALAQAVIRLAEDSDLRDRLEAGARKLAAEFTWDRIARRTAAVFGSLVKDK